MAGNVEDGSGSGPGPVANRAATTDPGQGSGTRMILSTMPEVRESSLKVAKSAQRLLSIFTQDLELIKREPKPGFEWKIDRVNGVLLHDGKPFFPGLVAFMSSGPILVLALEGDNAIADVRALNGATDPAKAAPGTIRHAFGPTMGSNVVHSSDSPESAAREISYWFSPDELFAYAQKSSVADE